MGSRPPYVYWDACIFIDGHQKTAGRYDHILAIENMARKGEIRIVTSVLSHAEVVYIKKDDQNAEEDIRQINQYFESKWVTRLPVDTSTAKVAAGLIRAHGVKPKDAIHLATAKHQRVDAMCTYDGFGDGDGMLALDRQLDGLRILTPQSYLYRGPLFEQTA